MQRRIFGVNFFSSLGGLFGLFTEIKFAIEHILFRSFNAWHLQHAHTALSFVGEILSLRYCHDFGAMGEFNLIFSPFSSVLCRRHWFGIITIIWISWETRQKRMTKRQNSPPQHEQTVQQQQRICVWLRRAHSIQIKLMRFLFIVNWEIFPLSATAAASAASRDCLRL